MPLYFAIGNVIVSRDELRQKSSELATLHRAVEANNRDISVAFSTGLISSDAMLASAPAPGTFTPIGMGKPLTVQIRHVYTGEFPHSSFFSPRKDMILTSAIKDITVYNAASRAVNFVRKSVPAASNFDSPKASEDGTPLVCYVPAITSPSSVLTLELVFDVFPDDFFGKLSSTFSNLSGIPIFLPSSGYLLAGSVLVKLVGNLGHALFDGKPAFDPNVSLDFDVPGVPPITADFRVVCNSDFDPTPFHFVPGKGLVDQAGKTYSGIAPYIVLSLDGKEQPHFANFTQTVASASLLKQFFDVQDGSSAVLDTFVDAMRLLNDSKLRTEADKVQAQIDTLITGGADANSDDVKSLKERKKALAANILAEVLKPK